MFESVREWVLWSPRRALLVVAGVAGALVLSVVVGAVSATRAPTAAPASTAGSAGPVVDEVGCRATVLAWGRVFTDASLPYQAWERSVLDHATPRTQAWLPYTDRSLVPAGPVTVDHVDADQHQCVVQVAFRGGERWEVRAVPDADRWVVDGWDDGS